jgi:hypothetical protein
MRKFREAALAVPVVIVLGAGLVLLMVRFRDSLHIVFVVQILLLRLSGEPARLLGLGIAHQAVKRSLARTFPGYPHRSRLPEWVTMEWGFRAAQIGGLAAAFVVLVLVQRVMGEPARSWPREVLHFAGSVALTSLVLHLLVRATLWASRAAFRFSVAVQQRRLGALYLENVDGGGAFERTEQTLMWLAALAGLVVPLAVVFAAQGTFVVVFALGLAVTAGPLLAFLLDRKRLPTSVFFELPRLFIPLQCLLASALAVLLAGGYAVLYWTRFRLGDVLGVTVPFNIPHVFDGVFALRPFDPVFATFAEALVLATAVSVLLTWLVAVFAKRAWSELALGVGAGLTVFAIPWIVETTQLHRLLSSRLIWVRPFILSVALPMVGAGVVNLVRERLLPRTRTCLACLYGGMTLYDVFCPRCGIHQADSPISLQEAALAAARRMGRAVHAMTGFDLHRLDEFALLLQGVGPDSAEELRAEAESLAGLSANDLAQRFDRLRPEEVHQRPAYARSLVRRVAAALRERGLSGPVLDAAETA